jgi:hypothetical protein
VGVRQSRPLSLIRVLRLTHYRSTVERENVICAVLSPDAARLKRGDPLENNEGRPQTAPLSPLAVCALQIAGEQSGGLRGGERGQGESTTVPKLSAGITFFGVAGSVPCAAKVRSRRHCSRAHAMLAFIFTALEHELAVPAKGAALPSAVELVGRAECAGRARRHRETLERYPRAKTLSRG